MLFKRYYILKFISDRCVGPASNNHSISLSLLFFRKVAVFFVSISFLVCSINHVSHILTESTAVRLRLLSSFLQDFITFFSERRLCIIPNNRVAEAIENKTAVYHRDIFCLPTSLKTSFDKNNTFYLRFIPHLVLFVQFKIVCEFLLKNPKIWLQKAIFKKCYRFIRITHKICCFSPMCFSKISFFSFQKSNCFESKTPFCYVFKKPYCFICVLRQIGYSLVTKIFSNI